MASHWYSHQTNQGNIVVLQQRLRVIMKFLSGRLQHPSTSEEDVDPIKCVTFLELIIYLKWQQVNLASYFTHHVLL